MRRISGMSALAGGAWLALLASWAVRDPAGIPPANLTAGALVAAAAALAAAARTASWAWRGPLLGAFPKEDVVVCAPREAAAVRAAAQLRGTLGGAGHLRRARLALPAIAWAFAAATALAGPEVADAAPWAALLGASASASLLLPARAFFYREAAGGRVVLHPASARDELVRSAVAGACLPGERGAP